MRKFAQLWVAVCIALCGAAMLWRAVERTELVIGAFVGVVFGAALGLISELPLRRAVRALLALVIISVGPSVAARSLVSPFDLTDAVVRFLSVGLPAESIEHLAVVPFLVVATACALATYGVLGRKIVPVIAASAVVVLCGGPLAAPVGSSIWIGGVLAVLLGVLLSQQSRLELMGIEPLASSATEVVRTNIWWRAFAYGIPPLAVGLVLAGLGSGLTPADPRRLVDPELERKVSVNPLTTAALLRDPPPGVVADDSPLLVRSASGGDPGRIRLAVLDHYDDTGWVEGAQYVLTGSNLLSDPVASVAGEAQRVSLTVESGHWGSHFVASPSAGQPTRVEGSGTLRYAPATGMLVTDDSSAPLTVETAVSTGVPDDTSVVSKDTGRYPVSLTRCPNSTLLSTIAAQLIAGQSSTLDRIRAIETFLKIKKIYSPQAPGGQTLRGVESFLATDVKVFQGNFEVYVTAMSLLMRCAGIPNRVVVGLPAHSESRATYLDRDVTAWVEVPFDRLGWVPFDPIPTPEEQQRQLDLANSGALDQPTSTNVVQTTVPRAVSPVSQPYDPPLAPWVRVVLTVLLVTAGIVVLGLLWMLVSPRLIRRRRRRIADPAQAIHAAWRCATDQLIDRELSLYRQLTPHEVTKAVGLALPSPAYSQLSSLVPLVDRAVFDADSCDADSAELAWSATLAFGGSLERDSVALIAPLRHPCRQWRRFDRSMKLERGSKKWGAVANTAKSVELSPDVSIPELGELELVANGSTSSVYRAVRPDASPIAVKVFRFLLSDEGLDVQRFDWECRVAAMISGMPHLQRFYGAGRTSDGRPYFVSDFFDKGTLFDRVNRRGPLTQTELREVAIALAAALEALHQNGVVHCDVKPENVFLSSAGDVVLGDLGSAWLHQQGGPAASMTPPYAAPEVWRGAPPKRQSDIYSLGLTLMFAASGRVPTAGLPPERDEVINAFGNDTYLSLLEVDPKKRLSSAGQVITLLNELHGTEAFGGPKALSLPTPSTDFRKPQSTVHYRTPDSR